MLCLELVVGTLVGAIVGTLVGSTDDALVTVGCVAVGAFADTGEKRSHAGQEVTPCVAVYII